METLLNSSISRRTLAKGAAWTVPAVMVGAPAHAFVSSLAGCKTVPWNAGTYSGGGSRRTYTYQGDDFRVVVTLNQQGGSGHGGTQPKADSASSPSRHFVGSAAGSQIGINQVASPGGRRGFLSQQGTGFSVDTQSTSSILTLSQGTYNGSMARCTLTWQFFDLAGQAVTPDEVSFKVFDVTATTSSHTRENSQWYTDVVTIGGGKATLSNASQGSQSFRISGSTATGISPSPYNGYSALAVTVAPTNNSFTLTYANSGNTTVTSGARPGYVFNSQYIGLGDFTIC